MYCFATLTRGTLHYTTLESATLHKWRVFELGSEGGSVPSHFAILMTALEADAAGSAGGGTKGGPKGGRLEVRVAPKRSAVNGMLQTGVPKSQMLILIFSPQIPNFVKFDADYSIRCGMT